MSQFTYNLMTTCTLQKSIYLLIANYQYYAGIADKSGQDRQVEQVATWAQSKNETVIHSDSLA